MVETQQLVTVASSMRFNIRRCKLKTIVIVSSGNFAMQFAVTLLNQLAYYLFDTPPPEVGGFFNLRTNLLKQDCSSQSRGRFMN